MMPRMLIYAALAAIPLPASAGIAGQPARTAGPDGATLYAYYCATCDGAGGGYPGTRSLEIKYKGEVPALLTRREDLDAEAVRLFVRNGIGSMPFFCKTEINDAELGAIALYLTKDRR